MNKRFASILCFLMTLMLALPAVAEPIITSSFGYTAYLGENNFLYLSDPDGVTKVLQKPIADLIGINEEFLYCTTTDGLQYEVRLDGSASRVMTGDPLLSDAYILEEGILNINGKADGVLSGIPNVEAAYATGNWLYYVASNTLGSYVLMSVPLPVPENTVPAPQVISARVSKPVSMTASAEAVVILTEDNRVEIIALAPLSGMTSMPLTDTGATHAFYFNGKLVTLSLNEQGQFTVLSAADHALVSPAALVTAEPTVKPTVAPTAKPTATMKPTATPRPAADKDGDDGRISKGDSGSAVRKMQRRLAELGYPVGTVDGDFGENTLLAVNLFQCAIGYRNRNYASAKMLEKLYSRKAPAYDPYAPLKEGDEGADVELMQFALVNLGYSVGLKGVDGHFGPDTKLAVEQYQFIAGLPVTGEADVDTLKKLYDVEHPIPNATATPVPTATPAPTATPEPTQAPTQAPTNAPTQAPTAAPTQAPTQAPTAAPTQAPTQAPTDAPTSTPDSDLATPTDLS